MPPRASNRSRSRSRRRAEIAQQLRVVRTQLEDLRLQLLAAINHSLGAPEEECELCGAYLLAVGEAPPGLCGNRVELLEAQGRLDSLGRLFD